MKTKIGIIGYGRFGKFLHKILSKTGLFEIVINSEDQRIDNQNFFTLSEVAKCDFVVLCIPISKVEKVVKKVSKDLQPGSTLVDVCSIKVYPKNVMLKFAPKDVNIVATHPMFGPGDFDPDNYKSLNGKMQNLNLVIENVRCAKNIYSDILDWIKRLGINCIEMTAKEHDRIAAKRQFVTLLTAFTLKGIKFKTSKIDTLTATNLSKSVDGVTIDFSLLKDIYKYNPYCKVEMTRYSNSFNKTVKAIVRK